MNTINNKKILITGGAGFLGKALIKRLYANNNITIYSRDEAKHYFLKKEYPKINCVVGSVVDKERLIRSGKNHDIGIFTASLKQISACDENPIEAINTICIGAINSRLAAEDNNFRSACFISTDKACEATTIYGSCKYTAEQSFIVNKSNVMLSTCRYGNVTNSTGSIIPLIKHSIINKQTLKLYSDTMSRFMITESEAVDLVIYSLLNTANSVVIPQLKSFLVIDLFDIYKDINGLQYILSQPRVGEKIHELMIGKEEAPRTKLENNYILISPNITYDNPAVIGTYSSEYNIVSKEELLNYLKELSLV
ncbi:MAG: polysaccharide biosynthesis protein [Candidatus Paceibacterota bacterium]